MSIFRKYERNQLRQKGLLKGYSVENGVSKMESARRTAEANNKRSSAPKKFKPKHTRRKV